MWGFSYWGIECIYFVSVVKLFYLVVMVEWLEGGMVNDFLELDWVVWDMIVDFSNDVISLVVDIFIGISSGFMLFFGFFEIW